MQDILKRLHQQDMGEDEEAGAAATDDEEAGAAASDDEEEEEEEELVPGISMERALLLDQGAITVDDLTPGELAAFQREVAAGGVAAAVDPWDPWWLSEEAAALKLGPSGTRLVAEVGPSGGEDGEGGVPPPPPAPLPPLSALTSRPPAPELALHLLDILYAYCLVLRLYNGQYTTDAVEAAATLLAASEVLGGGAGAPAASPSATLVDCIVRVCAPEAGRVAVPRGFAAGLVSDVAALLRLGRPPIVVALMDASRLVDAGLAEISGGERKDKALTARLKQAQRKLLFFLSWANEQAEALAPPLAAAAELAFEQQRRTLGGDEGEREIRIFEDDA